jgi:proteasome lid subunit RPN8/RPN11
MRRAGRRVMGAPTMDEPALLLPPEILAAMVGHCRDEAPVEACGILAGIDPPRVTRIYRLRNELASETRFNADPRDVISAVVAMRRAGEQMLAIYHSHPASEPKPSRIDLERNGYGPLPQVIVSLAGDEPVVRAWRLGETDFAELEWREFVEPESPPG